MHYYEKCCFASEPMVTAFIRSKNSELSANSDIKWIPMESISAINDNFDCLIPLGFIPFELISYQNSGPG